MGNNTAKLNVTVEISECTNSDYIVCFHSPRRSSTIYIYIYIYMCVCVCVCVQYIDIHNFTSHGILKIYVRGNFKTFPDSFNYDIHK